MTTYAPLLKKTDGLIDWEKPAILIEPFIRGMSPWPGAFTYWGNRRLKIFKAAEVQTEESALPGTILKSAPNELAVATSRGALSILEIQEASGSRLPVSDFLREMPDRYRRYPWLNPGRLNSACGKFISILLPEKHHGKTARHTI